MRGAYKLSRAALAAVAVATIWATQPGVAFADSAAPLSPEQLARDDLGFHIAIFACAAVAVALGVYFLWRVARSTREKAALDAWRGEESK